MNILTPCSRVSSGAVYPAESGFRPSGNWFWTVGIMFTLLTAGLPEAGARPSGATSVLYPYAVGIGGFPAGEAGLYGSPGTLPTGDAGLYGSPGTLPTGDAGLHASGSLPPAGPVQMAHNGGFSDRPGEMPGRNAGQSATTPRFIPGQLILKLHSGNTALKSAGASGPAGSPGPATHAQLYATLQAMGGTELLPVMSPDALRELQTDTRLSRFPATSSDSRSGYTRALPDDLTRTYIVSINPSIDPLTAARKITEIPGVAYAEPRVIMETTDLPGHVQAPSSMFTKREYSFLEPAPSRAYPAGFAPTSNHTPGTLDTTPNDPRFGDTGQNYFSYQRIPQAWETSTSDTSIVIAIVDSGVDYLHPDLSANLWRNPQPGRAKELFPGIFAAVENDTIGWNFWDSGPIFNPVQNGDPRANFSSHGTHVAGIAAASTNNGIGIAASGYHSRYMAVKAGGTADEPRAIGFGFEGILYAAVNGADIINASFGTSFNSQFGRDVVDFATSLGSLVVAAAGNTRQFGLFYPASYTNAVAVASVELNTGTVSNFSTYNFGIDVGATGRSILGTIPDSSYALNTGTSMASPIVAGVAALIRHAHPGWSPQRIQGQLRSTANPSIYNANPSLTWMLGGGLLDAEKAISEPLPAVRLVDAAFENQDGQRLLLNEDGTIRIRLTNTGETATALNWQIETVTGGGDLSTPGGSIGAVAAGDTLSFDIPLRIPDDIDPRENPGFVIRLQDAATGYDDFLHVEYQNLYVDTHDANRVRMSFSSNGGIGYGVGGDATTGVGFVPLVEKNGTVFDLGNVLYESGLMVMYDTDDQTWLVDNVRETDSAPLQFKPLNPFELGDNSDGTAQVGRALFNSDFNPDAPKLEVSMQTYAMTDGGPDQGILVFFTLENQDALGRTFENLYVGTYTDWDIANFSQNSIRFSEPDSLLIAYDTNNGEEPLVTVAHLNNVASALAIDNAWDDPADSLNFGVYFGGSDPGFTREYKRWSMLAGTRMTARDSTDISMVTSSGPFTLEHLQNITVGFAYLFGMNEDELRQQAALARAQEVVLLSNEPRIPVYVPDRVELVGNFPNPFNPATQILVDINQPMEADLAVYDMLGRRVTTLHRGMLDSPGRYAFTFDGSNLASGVYLVVMQTPTSRLTRKMLLLK